MKSLSRDVLRKLVPLILILGVGGPALAGTKDGGGGKGVLCIDDHGLTLRTLDLYEAEAVYGLKLIDHPARRDAILAEYGLRLGEHLDRTILPLENKYGRPKIARRFAKLLKKDILRSFQYLPKV